MIDRKTTAGAAAASKRYKMNRSALIWQALQEHLKRLRKAELEERDRRGYQKHPQRIEEIHAWEEAAAWPEETVARH